MWYLLQCLLGMTLYCLPSPLPIVALGGIVCPRYSTCTFEHTTHTHLVCRLGPAHSIPPPILRVACSPSSHCFGLVYRTHLRLVTPRTWHVPHLLPRPSMHTFVTPDTLPRRRATRSRLPGLPGAARPGIPPPPAPHSPLVCRWVIVEQVGSSPVLPSYSPLDLT